MPAFDRPSLGSLRERIRFAREGASVSDGMGNTTASAFRPRVTGVRARITPLKGSEAVLAARLTGTETYNVYCRSTASLRGVTTSDRLVNERTGLILNIVAIANPDERNEWLCFICQSGVAT